jgi:hypothetical protein
VTASGHVTLPPGKISQSGKVVVTLSSVAKTPPPIPPGTGRSVGPPKTVPIIPVPPRPAILPAKESSAPKPNAVGVTPGRTPQFSRTMEVKLPPKTGMLPKLTSLASMPVSPAGTKAKDENPPVLKPAAIARKTPPPLPPPPGSLDDSKNSAAKRRTGILLKTPILAEQNPAESIFIDPNAESPVMIPVAPRPVPAPVPAAPPSLVPETVSLAPDAPAKTPAEIPPQPLLSAAPVVPPFVEKKPPARPPPLPPPVLLADSLEVPTLHIAPPLVPSTPSEKLRLPPALHEPRRTSSLPPPPVARAPALSDTPQKISAPITVGVPIDHAPGTSAWSGAVPPRVSEPPAGENAVPAQPHVGKLAFPMDKLSPPVVPASGPEMEKAPPFKSTEKPADTEPPIIDPLVAGSPADVPSSSLLAGAPPIAPAEPSPVTEEPKTSTPEQPREIAALTPLVGAAALVSKAFDGKKIKTGQLSEPPPPTPRLSSTVRPSSGPPVPVISTPAGTPAVGPVPPAADTSGKTAATRTARVRKRRLVGAAIFYGVFAVILVLLYVLGLQFSQDTRVEGQVIPPPGMTLNNEVWIVNDFRELSGGIADDLAAERAPKLQEIQERQDHVHRAQADIASREERIRLLQEQLQAAKDEITSIVKQAHDAAQQVWDGPGAELENEYNSRLNDLQQAIAARAKSLKLTYQPDDTYHSPEVWANAYRLALYQTPPGVDGAKEHQWIEDQMTAWRTFTKSVDDRQQKLRAQAAQIQLSPTAHVADLNDKIEDLQHRVDSTVAEEEPIKAELQQAQADLDQAQTAEAGLDDKYYQQLDALPESNIAKRLPLAPDGRFNWSHPEKDSAFSAGEKTHSYWLFTRAIRPDGRQYWVLARFPISLDTIQPIMIPPESFLSTKAILRPDLSPDEQQQ